MRRYVVSCVFAGCIALAPPLMAAPAAAGETVATTTPDAPAVAVQQVRVPLPGLRDEAAMVLVGTALIGLAAAVRRAA
jgi:hypothetical protein